MPTFFIKWGISKPFFLQNKSTRLDLICICEILHMRYFPKTTCDILHC
jgi:hypothetical protein